MADLTRSVRGRRRPRNTGLVDEVLQMLNYDSFTKSVLHFPGADGSVVFTDDIGHVWTKVNSAQIDTAQSRFGGSSGLFAQATADYIYADGSSDFAFGNGDFTVEFFVRVPLVGTMVIYDSRPASVTGAYLCIFLNAGIPRVHVNAADVISGSTVLVVNQWYHIAVTRSGTSTKLFVNGYQEGATWTDNTVYLNPANRPVLGSNGNNPGVSGFTGHIDEFRISKGVARWTANFVPPGFEYAGVSRLDDSFTKSLFHFNGVDASVDSFDESGHIWINNGNAQLDTAQSKFGVSSLQLDGTGDWTDTLDHPDFAFGSEDFTIDFWFRTGANNVYIYGQSDATPTPASISVFGFVTAAGLFRAAFYSGGSVYFRDSAVAYNNSAWHHYASIRNGNNFYVAIDGTLSAALSVTGLSVNDSAAKFTIGRLGEHTATPFNGHIDEFRISKGIARWTANFTPPSGEY